MPKGRKFVPSHEEHGIWFRHRGMSEHMKSRSTGTTTGIMLQNDQAVDNNSHIKCPPLFADRLKAPHKRENPFSVHDNRNSFQDHGVYFGQGLGKQKIARDKSQHSSQDVVTWGKGNARGFQNGDNSLYREDFTDKDFSERLKHRRYLKHYPERPTGLVKLSSSTTLWVPKDDIVTKTYLQTLANTQEPHLKPNPWKYSYHARSFAVGKRNGQRVT